MNTVERVKLVAKLRGIPVSKLENELGFSNGYFGSLRKGDIPASRLDAVARYFGVSATYLLGGSDDDGLDFDDWGKIGMEFSDVWREVRNGASIVAARTGISEERIRWFFAGVCPLSAFEITEIANLTGFSAEKISPTYAARAKNAPSSKGEGDGITFDDFTMAMHSLSRDLTSTNKLALVQMAEQLAEAERKRRSSGDTD